MSHGFRDMIIAAVLAQESTHANGTDPNSSELPQPAYPALLMSLALPLPAQLVWCAICQAAKPAHGHEVET